MFAPRSRFQPGALSWRLLAGFLLLAMILGAILVADVANSRRVYETSGAVEHSDEVKIALRQILATLVDAETGQRGFVITGKTEYLEPYDRAIAEFSQNMARVRSMLHDHAAQQTDLERLSSLSETKLGELAEVIK